MIALPAVHHEAEESRTTVTFARNQADRNWQVAVGALPNQLLIVSQAVVAECAADCRRALQLKCMA